MTNGLFFLAVFAAAGVEMVEAITIILAVGATRGWREAWAGAAAAVLVLGVAVAVGGIPLIRFVPLDVLRVGVGIVALYVGTTWLKKAVLRSAGRKAKHDEDVIYAETVESLRKSQRRGFVVSFNGVLMEGTEVIVIVASVGLAQHRLGLAAAAAASAVLVVSLVAAILARQLSAVPENAIKMVVGVMVTGFGIFWLGEGLGLKWPAADASLLGVVGVVALVALGAVRMLKRERAAA
jgi:Ca2+/H+ antiporter, TMEM165/GDT1 family